MKHGEQFKVAFIGAQPRNKVVEGVKVTYFRPAFEINGKYYHVTSAVDISGQAGVVMFVKGGEMGVNGAKVHQDAFTLVFASGAGTIAAANEALAQFNG